MIFAGGRMDGRMEPRQLQPGQCLHKYRGLLWFQANTAPDHDFFFFFFCYTLARLIQPCNRPIHALEGTGTGVCDETHPVTPPAYRRCPALSNFPGYNPNFLGRCQIPARTLFWPNMAHPQGFSLNLSCTRDYPLSRCVVIFLALPRISTQSCTFCDRKLLR